MPADDRPKQTRLRAPRIPIREERFRQPEPAAELPDGVPAALIEIEESAGDEPSPAAPSSTRR